MTCDQALDVIATALKHDEPWHFQVAVVGYWIDGRPYPADGIAVNLVNTPNFARTVDGFECDAFFPPNILDAETVAACGIIRSPSGVEMTRVRVTVDQCDVWAIAEFIDGRQHDMFVNPGVMMKRKYAFAKYASEYRRRMV
jgi:hypothetical protein